MIDADDLDRLAGVVRRRKKVLLWLDRAKRQDGVEVRCHLATDEGGPSHKLDIPLSYLAPALLQYLAELNSALADAGLATATVKA